MRGVKKAQKLTPHNEPEINTARGKKMRKVTHQQYAREYRIQEEKRRLFSVARFTFSLSYSEHSKCYEAPYETEYCSKPIFGNHENPRFDLDVALV